MSMIDLILPSGIQRPPFGFMAAEVAAAPLPPGVDPEEIPKTRAELPELVSYTYDLSFTAAASLGIPVAGTVTGGASRRVVVFEWAQYKPVVGDGGIEYRYGFLIRFCLTVNKWDATATVSLPFLAAQAQIGNIQASWIMQVRGLTGPQISAVILPPQELSVETFVIAKQRLQQAISAADDPSTTFVPGTLLAIINPTAPEIELWLDAVKALTVSDILRGKTQGECQQGVPGTDPAALEAVASVFEKFGISDPTAKPDKPTRERARKILNGISVDVD